MCGIIAYIGKKEAYPILIKGLEKLEYRGYDSAGIALLNGDLKVYKKAGNISEFKRYLIDKEVSGYNIGMAHTRWATHGDPVDKNAHPHFSQEKKFAIVHNGNIDNYFSMKKLVTEFHGNQLLSDTDTEAVVHLIENIYEHRSGDEDLQKIVRLALAPVQGDYALVVLSKDHPNEIVAAKRGRSLVIGRGKEKGEYYFASDPFAFAEYTIDGVDLEDGEIAHVKDGQLKVTFYKDLEDHEKTPYFKELEVDLAAADKGTFPHFMLKEIYEQPQTIKASMSGRINKGIRLGGLEECSDNSKKPLQMIKNASRLKIVACGTSWHAGLVAEYLFEELARLDTEVEYASEFRYRKPIINEDSIIIFISQSGETADTLAAIELAKSEGALVLGVCNVPGSAIPRETHAGIYTHAGREVSVASTKAFTAQVAVLTMMALRFAKDREKISSSQYERIVNDLHSIPSKVEEIFKLDAQIKTLAEKFKDVKNFLYLGRGLGFPVALEGALKLKEISYIHAEGLPAAEMKHGPIALIDKNMPVVVIATKNGSYDKILSNIKEVKARKGKVIAIVTQGDEEVSKMADYVIEIPDCDYYLMPLLSVIPLQLLSYHIAVLNGVNVDQPRNLAKSVTVE